MGIWLPQRRIFQPQDGAQLNVGSGLARGLVGLWVAGPGGIRQVLPVPLAVAMESAGRITPRRYGLAATAASASRRALAPNDTRWQPSAAMSFMHFGDLAGNTLSLVASEVSLNGFGVYSNRAYCRIGSAWADQIATPITNTATAATLGATYDGATFRVYGNGQPGGTQAITGTVTHASSGLGFGARANGTNANANGANALFAVWDRALTADEARQFHANPWQLFQPRRIWVPVAAGGGDPTGSLAATESGADTAAFAGVVLVSGALSASESGSDIAAVSGAVRVSGSLAATETGSDAAAISAGAVTSVTGSLAAVESGSDTAAISGAIIVSGSLSATETGSDTAVIRESTAVATGSLAATESGSDTAAFSALSLLYGSTTSVWYLPVRMYATGVSGVVDSTRALDNLRSLLPSMATTAVDSQGKFTPEVWRFLDYLVNVALGSLRTTLPDVTAAVEQQIAAQTAASQTTALLQQQTQANAEALAATVEVVTANALTGATQIPPVSRSYLEP